MTEIQELQRQLASAVAGRTALIIAGEQQQAEIDRLKTELWQMTAARDTLAALYKRVEDENVELRAGLVETVSTHTPEGTR